MIELIDNIIQWGERTRITVESKPKDQLAKLVSEFGEFATSVIEGTSTKDDLGDMAVVLILLSRISGLDTHSLVLFEPERSVDFIHDSWNDHFYVLSASTGKLADAIGKGKDLSDPIRDCIGSIKNICEFDCVPFKECLEHAYNEIKDRKGVMFEGTFTKESDPQYEDVMRLLYGANKLDQMMDRLMKD